MNLVQDSHRSPLGEKFIDGIMCFVDTSALRSFPLTRYKQGVHPSVMQKLAGHSTARITMEVYTHANMDAQRDAMEAMQQAFTKKSA